VILCFLHTVGVCGGIVIDPLDDETLCKSGIDDVETDGAAPLIGIQRPEYRLTMNAEDGNYLGTRATGPIFTSKTYLNQSDRIRIYILLYMGPWQ
jgi:hypothetical protein